MSDEPDNLVLQLLREIRATQETHTTDLSMIKRRLTTMGGDIAALRQDAAREALSRHHAEERTDTLEDRVARIESRLGIVD